ncbi:MAG: HNH endonuclease signature motif containing protein [Alphaproteobacteria bacterium]
MTYQYPSYNGDEILKRAVWAKGRAIPNYDPDLWRHDACGHPMRYSDHGNTTSKFGWEIDHVLPLARGGTDELDNLQPLFWENNRRKGDTYPWYCENAA